MSVHILAPTFVALGSLVFLSELLILLAGREKGLDAFIMSVGVLSVAIIA
jgi:hypothetical protein